MTVSSSFPKVWRSAICLSVTAFGGVAVVGCSMIEHATKIRVTGRVLVNGKLYEGSSVQEYRCTKGGGLLGSMNVARCRVRGEAVAVDMGDRGTLFITLKNNADTKSTFDRMMRAKPYLISRSWPLPADSIPLMVMFRDKADPMSVVKVSPSHLEAAFGPGVRLEAVRVSYSSSFVTHGRIEERLQWLKRVGTRPISGRLTRVSGDLSDNLSIVDFIGEVG